MPKENHSNSQEDLLRYNKLLILIKLEESKLQPKNWCFGGKVLNRLNRQLYHTLHKLNNY